MTPSRTNSHHLQREWSNTSSADHEAKSPVNHRVNGYQSSPEVDGDSRRQPQHPSQDGHTQSTNPSHNQVR